VTVGGARVKRTRMAENDTAVTPRASTHRGLREGRRLESVCMVSPPHKMDYKKYISTFRGA